MLGFKRLFRFYINGSIHVAFAVVSLYLVSTQTLNIFVNWYLFGFLFFSTIVCYNFVKYGVEAEKYLIVAKPSHRPIQIFSFFAFGLCLICLFNLQPVIWGYIFFLTLISALYAIPFLPNSKNLRSLGGLKIFLIALIWTGFTYILALIDNAVQVSLEVVIHGIRRFLLVLVLILPFEIRDLKYDDRALRTLPQRYGVLQTKRMGFVLVLIYWCLGFLTTTTSVENVVFDIALTSLLLLTIYKTKEEQTSYYASFWVEGIPMLMLLILYVLEWVLG
jgi:hypothetical protein